MRIRQIFFSFGRTGLGLAICLGALLSAPDAHALTCSTAGVTNRIISAHNSIRNHTNNQFQQLRQWLSNEFARQAVIPGMQGFSEQMSSVSMHGIFVVGTFLDAKHQLETQRLFQELQIQAQKDYQPSESFCAFGTNTRSLAHSESAGRYNALAMSQHRLSRHLGSLNMAGAESEEEDKIARWKLFTDIYCDPQDNNWSDVADSGLTSVCESEDSDRINIDVDYTRMIENRRTISLSYPYWALTEDETDVTSLANNLYGHDVLFRVLSESTLDDKDKDHMYLKLRSVAAKRSVAENSFNAIVGLKSAGSAGGAMDGVDDTDTNAVHTYRFLGAALTELGIPEDEVKEYLGMDPNADWVTNPPDHIPDPSYFAQLEILAKKIYQSPNFYANLYDTPVNIRRKSAALKAIELMLDRAIYESQLRQEMSMSVLLSTKLQKDFESVDAQLGD